MQDKLILVDYYDNQVGEAGKAEAHGSPLLHRAFSIFLYDYDEDGLKVLLQQRHHGKYHSGGLWTNACCSHPRAGETLPEAAARRLREELGVSCPLERIGSFIYYHQFHQSLYEYEYDHVLMGRYGGSLAPAPEEISDTAWIGAACLAEDLRKNPRRYTPWFPGAAGLALAWLGENGRPQA